MKRTASLYLLLACLAISGCRRAATAQPAEPAPQAAQIAAQPQPTVCVVENMSRAALLQKSTSRAPKMQSSPTSKR